MRELMVKFYKDFGQGGNGMFATVTTASDPGAFLDDCASALERACTEFEGIERALCAPCAP